MLHSLGVLVYSPPLANAIRTEQELSSGHSWEIQLRGCSIWYDIRNPGSQCEKLTQAFFWGHRAVELIRREIVRHDPGATNVNAVLIDFFLYDLAKEKEAAGEFISVAALWRCDMASLLRVCRKPAAAE